MQAARPGRLPVLHRLAAGHAAGRRRGQPGGPRLLRPAGRRPAGGGHHARSPRSTTGTCRRPCRTGAAGRSATTAERFAEYAAVVAERARRPRHRLGHPQRAAVLGLDRPPRGHAWRPAGRPDRGRARLVPPAPRPRPRHAGDPRPAHADAADRHRQQPQPDASPPPTATRTAAAARAPTATPTAGGSTRSTAAATRRTWSSCTASTCRSRTATWRRSPPRWTGWA